MVISWITNLPLFYDNGAMTSNFASTRYRILIPAEILHDRGHKVSIFPVYEDSIDDRLMSSILASDIVVIGKSKLRVSYLIAEKAKKYGKRVVVDICDNHFDSDLYGPLHRDLVAIADAVTGNSLPMKELLFTYTKRPVFVVSDPYESQRGKPQLRKITDVIKLLWYGHTRNINALFNYLETIEQLTTKHPVDLLIVTTPSDKLQRLLDEFKNNFANDRLRIFFEAWSPAVMTRALTACDIVILPNEKSANSDLRSNNRVVEALWSGRYVVATPVATYEEFSPWIYLGDDINSAVINALQNNHAVERNIKSAQEYIALNYSPQKIADQWEQVLSSTLLGQSQ